MKLLGVLSGGNQFWQNSTICVTLSYIKQTRKNVELFLAVCEGSSNHCLRDTISQASSKECCFCFGEALLLAGWCSGKIIFQTDVLKDEDQFMDTYIFCLAEDPFVKKIKSGNKVIFTFNHHEKVLTILAKGKSFNSDLFLDSAFTMSRDKKAWHPRIITELDKVCAFLEI
ncbi:MAG: hypothetical protein NZT61_01920 [Deltaproteobacteria bacterium]|nr:hypothetical protein [Deltaproteobacteria bacterium]MCX7953274.1 hypothetical protein [Deltaproteobacteria bacterium]